MLEKRSLGQGRFFAEFNAHPSVKETFVFFISIV